MKIHKPTSIGGFLPDVKIDKVTLNASSAPISQRHPHIEHPSESTSTSINGPDNLIVELHMYIRDKANYTSAGSWFGNIDFEKYMKIKLIQILDPFVSLTGFRTAPQAMQTLNSLNRIEKYRHIIKLIKKAEEIDFVAYNAETPAIVSVVDIPCFDAANFGDAGISSRYVTTDSGGATYYDVSYKKRFVVSSSDPVNLYYMAFTTIDHEALASDFGLEPDSPFIGDGDTGALTSFGAELGALIGDINFATVYTNGQIKKTTKYFLTPGGEIYTGPKHVHAGRFMAGQVHKSQNDAEHFPLTVINTQNNKICDNRQIKRITQNIGNMIYSIKKQVEVPASIKILSEEKIDLDYDAYISDPIVTFDSCANPRVCFSLNLLQLARDKFVYGALLQKEPATGPLLYNVSKEVFSKTEILNLEIFRQRVDSDGLSETSPEELVGSTYISFDNNSAGETISLHKKEWRNTSGVVNEPDGQTMQTFGSALIFSTKFAELLKTGMLPEKNYHRYDQIALSQVAIEDITEETRFNNTTKKIKTFSFVDYSAKSAPGAKFAYKLKFTVRDGSIHFIKKIINQAYEARAGLNKYLSEATSLGIFNSARERFSQQYVQDNATKILNQYVKPAQASLFNMHAIFTHMSNESFNMSSAMNALSIMVRPHVATPETVHAYVTLYDRLLLSLIKLAGLKNVSLKTGKSNTQHGSETTQNIFDSSNSKPSIIEIEIPIKAGFNCMADKQKPELIVVPEQNDLAFDIFSQTSVTNNVRTLGGIVHGADIKTPGQYFSGYNVERGSRLIKISANQFETLKDFEVKKFFKGNEYAQVLLPLGGVASSLPGSTSPTAAGQIPYQPYSNLSNNTYFTPTVIKSYENGDSKNGFILYEGTVHTAIHQLRIRLAFLKMIAKSLGIATNSIISINSNIGAANTAIPRIKNSIRYLLVQIGSKLGMFQSQAVLNVIAGKFQDTEVFTSDENQQLTPDALSQLGIDEHVQDGNSNFGLDLDEGMDEKMQNLLSYLIYANIFFPENKKGEVVSYNIESPVNQVERELQRLMDSYLSFAPDAVNNFMMILREKIEQYLPMQIKYLLSRDTGTGASAEVGATLTNLIDIYQKHNSGTKFKGECLDYDNFPKYMLANTNLYKTEYIDGFAALEGNKIINMKSPIIKRLTSNELNNNSGRTLLCMLKKFEDRQYIINMKDYMDYNVMNDCFMVEIPAVAGTTSNSPADEEPIEANDHISEIAEFESIAVGDDFEEANNDGTGAGGGASEYSGTGTITLGGYET